MCNGTIGHGHRLFSYFSCINDELVQRLRYVCHTRDSTASVWSHWYKRYGTCVITVTLQQVQCVCVTLVQALRYVYHTRDTTASVVSLVTLVQALRYVCHTRDSTASVWSHWYKRYGTCVITVTLQQVQCVCVTLVQALRYVCHTRDTTASIVSLVTLHSKPRFSQAMDMHRLFS